LRPRFLCTALILTLTAGAEANTGERGKLFIQAFPPADYAGSQQVWDVVQNRLGFIYAANNVGVIEYDGARWRTIDAGSEVGRHRAEASRQDLRHLRPSGRW
jgi:hypothetical protein